MNNERKARSAPQRIDAVEGPQDMQADNEAFF